MPKLCKAGQQLREQVDDAFPDRDRTSDGWIGDKRHSARKSDHNPTAEGIVRALDLDVDFRSHKAEPYDFADQLRLLARLDKRISYIIFNGKIASYKRNYKWRKYTGINPHKTHIHISFTAKGDSDGSMFEIPILTGEPLHGTTKASKRKLGKKLFSSWNSNLFSGGLGSSTYCKCCTCGKPSSNPSLVKS
jgi:hypothetical protein